MIDASKIAAARLAVSELCDPDNTVPHVLLLSNFINEVEAAMKVEREDSAMCPNCVTPWKCNGPHESPALSSQQTGQKG